MLVLLGNPTAARESSPPETGTINALTPGELIVDPPTLTCLGFYWPIKGDGNRNAVCRIEFRKVGDEQWRRGLDLWRTSGEIAGAGGMARQRRTPNAFAGSLFDLEPGAAYECRLTVKDPDGVNGKALRTVTTATRPEPVPAQGGRVLHVYPYDFKGERKDPQCDGISGVWGGVRPVHPGEGNTSMPRPGDIYLIHAGVYKGIRNCYRRSGGVRTWFDGTFYFVASGTAEKPIVFKAAGDGEVIVDGDGCEALFDVTAANYVYLEGLTFRNARIAIRACNPLGGCTGLTVKRCKFEKVGYGIRGEAEPSGDGTVYGEDYAFWKQPGFKMPRDFYLADNAIRGWYSKKVPQRSPQLYGETLQPESGDGIRLVGAGHVVCHNHVEGFWDNYGLHGFANDCYNNTSGPCTDNPCEADGSTRNVRFMRNRFGITAQPILGGPVYFIRNLGGPGKMVAGSTGVVAYHNSTGIISSYGHSLPEPGEARPASGSSCGTTLFMNNAVRGVNFGTHSPFTRLDYNAYAPGASFRYYSRQGRIMSRSFEEFRRASGHEQHGFQAPAPVVAGKPVGEQSPLIDAAVLLPNVNDDYTGDGPDIGPYEVGKPVPHYGPRPEAEPGE